MNRIKELRHQRGLTLKELSEQLQKRDLIITPDALAKYERGDREPKIEIWQKLADFFGVSVPYLIGISNWPIPCQDNEKHQDYMIYLKGGQTLMVWDIFENLLSKMQTKKAFIVETSEDDKYIVNPSNVLWISD